MGCLFCIALLSVSELMVLPAVLDWLQQGTLIMSRCCFDGHENCVASVLPCVLALLRVEWRSAVACTQDRVRGS
jgi:hypothetical protein